VTISPWQWEKSERLDSTLEVLHGIHEHGGKQLFDLTTTTTVARRTSTPRSHTPFGPGLTDRDEFTQDDERRDDVDKMYGEKVERELGKENDLASSPKTTMEVVEVVKAPDGVVLRLSSFPDLVRLVA
jgi:hypothetical protein